MPDQKPLLPVRTSILVLPETTPTAMYGMHEILSSVGVMWPLLMTGKPGAPRFDVSIVSADGKPFRAPSGAPIAPDRSLDAGSNSGEPDNPDLVIVTDVDLPPGQDPRCRWTREVAWLRERHERGATIAAVCMGSIVLARAGLLDGIEATTHWWATRIIAENFPRVILRPERMIQPAGREHRIITAGGASAWQDLLLYLVARFASPEEARHAAKIFLLGDRSEGQLPFAMLAVPHNHGDRIIANCQEWIAQHYDDPSPVARMAAISGLPERTFKRRFKVATGYTPIDYVQSVRIEEAKQLLETSDLPTDHIGHEIGYEEPAFFRRLFKRKVGVTPARYRQRFKSMNFAH